MGSEDIEEIYINAHAAIREDPAFKPSDKSKDWKSEALKYHVPKLTLEQRRANIAVKIEKFKAGGNAEEPEDEEE